MVKHELKLKCSCGFEEVLIPEMEENGLQIYIGLSEDTPNEVNNLVLDCKKCGTKLSLLVVSTNKKEEDVPEEIRNEG